MDETRGAEHLTREDLERLGDGELAPERARVLREHFARSCRVCAGVLAPLLAEAIARGEELPGEPAPRVDPYAFPVARAAAAARTAAERLEQARDAAWTGFDEIILGQRSPGQAPELTPYDAWAWCELLLEMASLLRERGREGARELAEAAAMAADNLPAGVFPEEARVHLQVRAWIELANARRVAEELDGAEGALAEAIELLRRAPDQPLIARVLDVAGSLLRGQRRFDEALQALDAAAWLYKSVGDEQRAGRVLVKKGLVHVHAAEPELALLSLGKALDLLDADRDKGLVLMAVHNTLLALVDAGEAARADRMLWLIRPLYRTPIEKLRGRWLEGRIAAGVGQLARAERILREVKTQSEEARLPYEAALVTLDLAAVLLEQGGSTEVLDLVDGMFDVFRDLGIRREAIAALLVLRKAVQQGEATAELVRGVARELAELRKS